MPHYLTLAAVTAALTAFITIAPLIVGAITWLKRIEATMKSNTNGVSSLTSQAAEHSADIAQLQDVAVKHDEAIAGVVAKTSTMV